MRSMPWQVLIVLYIVLSYVIHPVLKKRISAAPSRTRNLVWQYFFAAILAGSTAVICKTHLWDRRLLIVMVIGAFNAFACYCSWRAVAISMSKTAIATQWDDMITLGLGYLVLNEGKLLNPILLVGVVISVGSALFFTLVRKAPSTEMSSPTATPERSRLGLWIILYSVIWGGAVFSMRYFALEGISLLSYVAAWYAGSFLGALVVFAVAGKKEAGENLTRKQVVGIIPLAASCWLPLMTEYWISSLAPTTVYQPIYQVAEMVLPTIIGLWLFKEAKDLRPIDKAVFAVGMAGGLIIVLSY